MGQIIEFVILCLASVVGMWWFTRATVRLFRRKTELTRRLDDLKARKDAGQIGMSEAIVEFAAIERWWEEVKLK